MRVFYLLISIAFLFCSCQDKVLRKAQKEGEPDLYTTPSEDHEMNQAIVKAKNSFNKFDEAFKSKHFDSNTFTVKMKFPTDAGAEHIWITNIESVDYSYFGVVNNEPEATNAVKLGDRIKIDKNEISDWMYSEQGKLRGGYTIRLIRSRMSAQEKELFDSQFPYTIED